jgi:hypothetical protein
MDKTLNEEINELRINNKKLSEFIDKMRSILISYVNHCKCKTQINNRIKFNLLMETIYEFRDKQNPKNCCQNQTQNLNQLIIDGFEVSFEFKVY